MLKDSDIKLTCHQCGKEFVFIKAEQEFYEGKGFTSPHRCKECRSTKKEKIHSLVCSQCGTQLKEEAPIYCTACLANVQLEFELKANKTQKATNEVYKKLQSIESEKAEFAELIRQKEQEVNELEQKVDNLSRDLEEVHQLQSALNQWFQPTLNGIEERVRERLEALEYGQNKINERMLQIVEKMHEMYENTTILELIKRSLRYYQRKGTQPT